jgi:primosomal protein N' (replication factor Y)
VCAHCGSSTFKQLRPGIGKAREELESLARRPVGEVSGESDELPQTGVIIGTEAVLHRIGRADAVAFIDFDQELLATRYQAPEDALVLLARASRIVGGHHRHGVV